MASVKVNIAPQVLSWILKKIDQNDSTRELFETLAKWQNGEDEPTFHKVEIASKKSHIPLGYFFLNTPPKEYFPILEYRTIDSNSVTEPSRDLIDTIYQMEEIQTWMRDYLIDNGTDAPAIVGSLKQERDILVISEAICKSLHLERDWYKKSRDIPASFRHLRALLGQAGILVMVNSVVGQNTHRNLDIEEFRAFTLLDEYAPLIFINGKDTSGGKLFSLLHEAAHIWLGVGSFFNSGVSLNSKTKPLETICNAVAAEILVPNTCFQEQWESKYSYETIFIKISAIARYFKCGEIVIARRAFDSRYITQADYDAVVQEVLKKYLLSQTNKHEQNSGPDYYTVAASKIDHNFLLALDLSIKNGKTLFTDALHMTHTNRKTFDELLNMVKGGMNE